MNNYQGEVDCKKNNVVIIASSVDLANVIHSMTLRDHTVHKKSALLLVILLSLRTAFARSLKIG